MKVLSVITSRASYSRIKSVLQAFSDLGVDFAVACAASANEDRFGNVARLIEQDGFPIVSKITSELEAKSGIGAVKTTGLGLLSIGDLINAENPKAVITIADRYETIATAVAASYQGCTCIHIQGGEITGNIDDKVRDAVTCLSDIHFPATESAAERVRVFAKHPEYVFNFGCPSVDLFVHAPLINRAAVWDSVLRASVGGRVDQDRPYFVLMLHPETTSPAGPPAFLPKFLRHFSGNAEQLIVFWPNSDPGSDEVAKTIRVFREECSEAPVRYVKNVPSDLFVNILRHSAGLIGNSSVGVRESGVLGIPVVDVGGRQSGRVQHPNVTRLPYSASAEQVIFALHSTRNVSPSFLYGDGSAGRKIAEQIIRLL